MKLPNLNSLNHPILLTSSKCSLAKALSPKQTNTTNTATSKTPSTSSLCLHYQKNWIYSPTPTTTTYDTFRKNDSDPTLTLLKLDLSYHPREKVATVLEWLQNTYSIQHTISKFKMHPPKTNSSEKEQLKKPLAKLIVMNLKAGCYPWSTPKKMTEEMR